jgi:hypothetical protein
VELQVANPDPQAEHIAEFKKYPTLQVETVFPNGQAKVLAEQAVHVAPIFK